MVDVAWFLSLPPSVRSVGGTIPSDFRQGLSSKRSLPRTGVERTIKPHATDGLWWGRLSDLCLVEVIMQVLPHVLSRIAARLSRQAVLLDRGGTCESRKENPRARETSLPRSPQHTGLFGFSDVGRDVFMTLRYGLRRVMSRIKKSRVARQAPPGSKARKHKKRRQIGLRGCTPRSRLQGELAPSPKSNLTP